jgi:hypothetical protein
MCNEDQKIQFLSNFKYAEFVIQLSSPVYFHITVPYQIFTFQIEMYFSEFVVLGFELNLKVNALQYRNNTYKYVNINICDITVLGHRE